MQGPGKYAASAPARASLFSVVKAEWLLENENYVDATIEMTAGQPLSAGTIGRGE